MRVAERAWCCALYRLFALVCVLALLAPCARSAPAHAQAAGPLYLAEVDGVVTGFTVAYLRRALREAEASNATALVIRLGGHGAVLRAVRPFAAEVARARVPVVVYVAPEGVASGAAGAFLLSAAHIAALTPATSFGSPLPLAQVDSILIEQTRALALAEVADQLRTWNAAQGRDTSWVARAVREGVVLSNEQAIALDPPAVQIVARNLDELLILLEGRTVTLASGHQLVLNALGRSLTPLAPTLWEQLLLTLASPTMAFLLLVLAALALYAELVTPTVGVLGGIGLLLGIGALVGLVSLPVNPLALLGMLLAFSLVFADHFAPSHGALTVAGMGVLVASALNLFDSTQVPGAVVALWAVMLVALLVAGVAALGLWLALRSRGQPATTGQEALVGQLAEVRRRLDPEGMVFVEGALWRAVCETPPIETGEYVRIVAVHNLLLLVKSEKAEG